MLFLIIDFMKSNSDHATLFIEDTLMCNKFSILNFSRTGKLMVPYLVIDCRKFLISCLNLRKLNAALFWLPYLSSRKQCSCRKSFFLINVL